MCISGKTNIEPEFHEHLFALIVSYLVTKVN